MSSVLADIPRSGHKVQDVCGWLEDFRARHGRPPRVLHIGNIANNGYNNAKLLNKVGVDCDVICHDYYHIMGCPEWEDAPFRGEIEDQFHPDWRRVDLAGFKRPRWFAQGPLRLCVRYLIARRRGRRMETALWWWLLSQNQNRSLLWKALARPMRWGCRALGAAERLRAEAREFVAAHRAAVALIVFGLMVLCLPTRLIGCITLLSGLAALARLHRRLPRTWRLLQERLTARGPSTNRQPLARELIERFAGCFPDRTDQLTEVDLAGCRSLKAIWSRLFRYYDVVVGYATDGRWPLLAGARPYLAYEHGTIRNIPFENTPTGRICALTYRLADGVFITNCDNLLAADRLSLSRCRFVPHAVNEATCPGQTEKAAELRAELSSRLGGADFLAFHPSRQHWEPRRHPDWEKGNDIFIKGFARFVREVNPRAGAVLVNWGQKVEESKALLKQLGVADRVLWIPPQPNFSMRRYLGACDVLADQFYLGAFGSTTPKALLHGCPAMLYLDEARHRWCFPEMPPVVNARTPEEVARGLEHLYRSPQYARDLARRGQDWYDRYHSNRVVVETFLSMFQEVLAPCPADAAA